MIIKLLKNLINKSYIYVNLIKYITNFTYKFKWSRLQKMFTQHLVLHISMKIKILYKVKIVPA